jgi:hypothetical protein
MLTRRIVRLLVNTLNVVLIPNDSLCSRATIYIWLSVAFSNQKNKTPRVFKIYPWQVLKKIAPFWMKSSAWASCGDRVLSSDHPSPLRVPREPEMNALVIPRRCCWRLWLWAPNRRETDASRHVKSRQLASVVVKLCRLCRGKKINKWEAWKRSIKKSVRSLVSWRRRQRRFLLTPSSRLPSIVAGSSLLVSTCDECSSSPESS